MVVHALIFNDTGYGKLARSVVRAAGNCTGILSDNPLPEDLKPFAVNERPLISVSPPDAKHPAPIQYTMYESDVLRKDFVKCVNKRKLVLVPCRHNMQAFRASGVKVPIKILHPGTISHYIAPCALSPFTFIHVSTDSGVPQRKRTDDVIKAFLAAFKTEDDVRLIVKKSSGCRRLICFDKRVSLIYKEIPSKDLYSLLASAHVGVFLSGLESWGYPLMELMSIGRPVISPIYNGPAEYLDETCGYGLPFTLKRVPSTYFDRQGCYAHSTIGNLANVMRFCYENKEDTILRGVMAYRRSLGFSMNKMSIKLQELLNENTKFS